MVKANRTVNVEMDNISHPFRLFIMYMLSQVVRVLGVIMMVLIPLFISRLVLRWFRIVIIFPVQWVILDL